MTDDTISIEIDGKPLPARKGAMIIEVADAAGIHIPRFCYHPKLSVAANCRMCLVEVAKAPKPMPACATPVMDGMKVFTQSIKAVSGQKATMEFLLINHPLDCPICDQGGECELQDVAMGYGSGVSQFAERKRVVMDKNIGPLVATEMTRCIHCTRCIRFGDEIAGLRELGATGRGEDMEIGTYVQHSMASELSGNVIDLCPVGALTAKPSRFRARAWEVVQHESVAPHDSVGSNISLHTLRNRIIRVVPRANEVINEAWISDRDRFSYTALSSPDRATSPLVGNTDAMGEVEWQEALETAAKGLRRVIDEHGAESVGVLISPSATLEEMYLTQKLAGALGIRNVDHRLRQQDTSDQEHDPVYPWLGQSLVDLESLDAALLVGSNVRMEQPLAGHRIRKAALAGGRISFINSRRYDFRFPLSQHLVVAPQDLVSTVAGLAVAVAEHKGDTVPKSLAGIQTDAAQRGLADDLIEGKRASLLLGSQAMNHPRFAELRWLVGWIAAAADCRLGYLPEGANGAGGWLAGAVPHRLPGGQPDSVTGLSAGEMLAHPRKAYLLVGVEPGLDCAAPAMALSGVRQAEFVVSLCSWTNKAALAYSHVLLPMAALGETAGTWVNMEGRWQTVAGAVTPPGEARPAWKILRVLGNLLEVPGFDYLSADEVVNEAFEICRSVEPENPVGSTQLPDVGLPTEELHRAGDIPIYAVDAMVRRATPLQKTPLAENAVVRLNSVTAAQNGCEACEEVVVHQNGNQVVLPVVLDETVPDRCAWLPGGVAGTEPLGPVVGPVRLTVSG